MEYPALLQHLTEQICSRHQDSPLICAVSGVDGVGKTTLADELVTPLQNAGLNVTRASIDHFHHPRSRRYARGRYSPRGFFEDSFNLDRFEQYLLRPLLPDGNRQLTLQAFDHRTDQVVASEPVTLPEAAILLVDGIFLLQPRFRKYWHYAVWLDAPFEVTCQRAADRDQGHPDPDHFSNQRYVKGQRRYLRACRPLELADEAFDCSDWNNVRLLKQKPSE